MYDQRGVKRSFCTQCSGEEPCIEFEKSDLTPFCGYCGCPPIKHKRVDMPVDNADAGEIKDDPVQIIADDNQNDVDVRSSVSVDTGYSDDTGSKPPEIPQVQTENETSSLNSERNENLNLLIPELPRFSPCIQQALNSGSINGPLWTNLIMQCATYYRSCETLKTKTQYEALGRSMFEKYPCIEGPGTKPWSHFNKCLSQRLRTERMKLKNMIQEQKKKDFSVIANDSDKSKPSKSKASDEKKRTFFRSEANLPLNLSEAEVLEAKKKIATEWAKENHEKALIKSLLRDTYNHRTTLLKEGVSFDQLLNNYPCFSDANYVLYEFSILLGRNKMLELGEKMKDFFKKVHQYRKDGSTEGDMDMLSHWLWFEKKSGIFQTKAEKSASIFQVVMDPAEYKKKLEKPQEFPCGIILFQDKEIRDGTIICGTHMVQCSQLSIPCILTVLLGLYYILELNYPKQYMQSMGALATYVLKHEYYKLGMKAHNLLRNLKGI